jgi:hypothetical protein
MAIDYSGFAIPKQRPKALDKASAKAERAKEDKKESAKAKKRAKGQCEVMVEQRKTTTPPGWEWRWLTTERCKHKDTETHHLIGGIGRRNKGKSILADYKLRVCRRCHEEITTKILKPTTADHDAHTVRYWRAK